MKGAWSPPSQPDNLAAEAQSGDARARFPLAGLLAMIVVLLAFGIRAMRSREGLPYILHGDEPQTAGAALRMMQTGDYNPHFFKYGSLGIYMNLIVDVLHYFYLMGQPEGAGPYLRDLGEIKTQFDTGWHWTISHPSFYLWNRWLTAALGAGCVWLAYTAGKEIRGKWAGLAAAAFLAGLEVHVEHSAIVTPDLPVAFFVLLAVYLSMLYEARGRPACLVWSFVATGLAASTKYNAAVCIAVPLLALAWSLASRAPCHKVWMWVAGPASSGAAFVAGTPYAVLDLPNFLRGAGYEVFHYSIRGHPSATVEPGIAHLLLELQTTASNLGWIASALALAGIAVLARRKTGWLVLCFPVVYLACMSRMRVSWHRNFIVIYPLAAVAAGCGVVLLYQILVRLESSRKDSKRAASRSFAALATLLPLAGLASAVTQAWSRSSLPETRTQAILGLNDRIEGAGMAEAKVGIAEEARIHALDLARLHGSFVVRPYLDLLCDAPSGAYDFILTAERFDALSVRNKEIADLLNSVTSGASPHEESIGLGRPVSLDEISINPAMIILEGRSQTSAPAVECWPPIPFSEMAMTDDYQVSSAGYLEMTSAGALTTPPLDLAPGSYAFVWRARGTRADGSMAKLKVTLLEYGPGGQATQGNEEVFETALETRPFIFRWETAAPVKAALRIWFINDAYSAALREDRNAYIQPVRLVKLRAPAP